MTDYKKLDPDARRDALMGAFVYFSEEDPQALLDFEAKHRGGGCECLGLKVEDVESDPEPVAEVEEPADEPEVDEPVSEVEGPEEGDDPGEAPEVSEEAAEAPEEGEGDGEVAEETPEVGVDWAAMSGENAKAAMKDASADDLKAALEDARKGVREAAEKELAARG